MAWAAIRYGQNAASSTLAWAMITARNIPSTIEIARPIIEMIVVQPSPVSISTVAPIERLVDYATCGAVTRNDGLSKSASSAQ